MPRFPHFSNRVQDLGGSIFERYEKSMRAQGDNLVRMHIGDTYRQPDYPLALEEHFRRSHPDFNCYPNTFGTTALRRLLLEKVNEDNFELKGIENIMVSSGGTHALSAAMMAILNPGDEVIIPTPAWPLYFGIVKLAGGTYRELPLFADESDVNTSELSAALESCLSERTVAIYVNSPNNPSGRQLTRAQLQTIIQFAERRKLWIIADEAYDGLVYDGEASPSLASLPGAFERTLTVFTFSKLFMFAGIRLGYLTGPAEAVRKANAALVHQIYSAQMPGQLLLEEAVRTRREWKPRVIDAFRQARDHFMLHCPVDIPAPAGGYFAFFDVKDYLNGRDYWDVIEECIDGGVSPAAGINFGSDFGTWLRLCFTGEPHARLQLGLERLGRVLVNGA